MDKVTKYIIATGVIVTIVAIVLIASLRISNTGTIKTLGLNCDTQVIDWGELAAGYGANYTIQVQVTDSPANLTLYTENWNPPNAADYIHLTWDYNGEPLQPTVWVPITLTLTVDQDITGISNYSFDIKIVAEG
jgi:hypothetical protein